MSRKRTVRDIGRAAGHPDPIPGACPECGYREPAERVREELIQVVAMALACADAIEGDAEGDGHE